MLFMTFLKNKLYIAILLILLVLLFYYDLLYLQDFLSYLKAKQEYIENVVKPCLNGNFYKCPPNLPLK
jgi:hypothetical protein